MYVITRGQDQPDYILQPGEIATIAISLMDSAVLAERATLGLSDADLPDAHSVKDRSTSRYGPRRGEDCMDHRRQIKDYHRLLTFPPEAA